MRSLAGKDRPDQTGVLRGIETAAGDIRDHDATSLVTGGSSREELQRVMTRDAGVLRDAVSLDRARAALAAMTPSDEEVANLLVISEALVEAALAREESRGTHTRLDYPEPDPAFLGRFVFGAGLVPSFVGLPEPATRR